jgi:hypothetical protein
MDEVRLAINSRRLFIMVIAPEFVITWAMRQIFGAYAAPNDFNYESSVQCAQTHIDDRVISGNSCIFSDILKASKSSSSSSSVPRPTDCNGQLHLFGQDSMQLMPS